MHATISANALRTAVEIALRNLTRAREIGDAAAIARAARRYAEARSASASAGVAGVASRCAA